VIISWLENNTIVYEHNAISASTLSPCRRGLPTANNGYQSYRDCSFSDCSEECTGLNTSSRCGGSTAEFTRTRVELGLNTLRQNTRVELGLNTLRQNTRVELGLNTLRQNWKTKLVLERDFSHSSTFRHVSSDCPRKLKV